MTNVFWTDKHGASLKKAQLSLIQMDFYTFIYSFVFGLIGVVFVLNYFNI